MLRPLLTIVVSLVLWAPVTAADQPLRIATFRADVTPPLGFGAYGVAETIVDPLSARGLVILSDRQPIVVCAVDWIGLKNAGYDAFRERLATAAGTTRERVNGHCLHQHDAPGVDFTAEAKLAAQGRGGKSCDVAHAHRAIEATARALADAVRMGPRKVTHLLSSLGIGWLCGGSDAATRRASAIVTAARNAAVGLVIATGNFADTLAVTAVVSYGLVSILGTFACGILFGKCISSEMTSA